MVLHLGGDVVVSTKEIIAILDIAAQSRDTQEYIRNARQMSSVIEICEEPHKSIIITQSRKRSRVYLSPISAATLCKRSAFVNEAMFS